MLCSKDLVKRAIEFRNPERVPYNFDSNRTPVITTRYGDDFEWVFSVPPDDVFPRALGSDRYMNEFGVDVDVLQIDQQDNMGIDELARRFAGRICFFCPVDIQTTLPVGSPAAIEAKAKHLMQAFGSRKQSAFRRRTQK